MSFEEMLFVLGKLPLSKADHTLIETYFKQLEATIIAKNQELAKKDSEIAELKKPKESKKPKDDPKS